MCQTKSTALKIGTSTKYHGGLAGLMIVVNCIALFSCTFAVHSDQFSAHSRKSRFSSCTLSFDMIVILIISSVEILVLLWPLHTCISINYLWNYIIALKNYFMYSYMYSISRSSDNGWTKYFSHGQQNQLWSDIMSSQLFLKS